MAFTADSLFTPFQNPKLNLKNRLVMAPMTRNHSPNGTPGQDVVEYYQRRAAGEVGLIITEGTTVDHSVASNDVNVPFFHGDAALAGWGKVVEAVHTAGGKICPQLWHMGAQRESGTGPNPELDSMGPSGLSTTGEQTAKAMTQHDIDDVIGAFVNAAISAKALNFDGIELHGAHGYLLDQFFWAKQNKRNDKYAGSIAARTRFVVEIVEAIRHEVGANFPIILRFSQFKIPVYDAKIAKTPKELDEFISPLIDAGVDIFHASARRFWEAEFADSELTLAGWAKKISGKPTIAVGSVGLDVDFMSSFGGAESKSTGIENLLTRLDQEEFDLVAVGRALIGDPNWGKKIHQGQEDSITVFNPENLQSLL
ncbi:MAG: NADH:flavin oxidoreductase [Gammaproteobacteria bacterium]|jgi:2,4-dienoyl-CoA reductase-like NADH-dependent reductase (Old Yellow Enzyme family)|nr:NADH:flavin oxidoreductase [Gammaproteobacteria bacterium]